MMMCIDDGHILRIAVHEKNLRAVIPVMGEAVQHAAVGQATPTSAEAKVLWVRAPPPRVLRSDVGSIALLVRVAGGGRHRHEGRKLHLANGRTHQRGHRCN